MMAQNSLQVKLLSTSDVDRQKIKFDQPGFSYTLGFYYQQVLSKKTYWIAGIEANKINNKPLGYDCPVGETFTHEKGFQLNPSVGIKKYVRSKKENKLFAGLNLIGLYSRTKGTSQFWLPESELLSFQSQTFGMGLEPNIGIEINMHPKFYLLGQAGYWMGMNKRTATVPNEQGRLDWTATPHLTCRLGYRF